MGCRKHREEELACSLLRGVRFGGRRADGVSQLVQGTSRVSRLTKKKKEELGMWLNW